VGKFSRCFIDRDEPPPERNDCEFSARLRLTTDEDVSAEAASGMLLMAEIFSRASANLSGESEVMPAMNLLDEDEDDELPPAL
jgi:hypothetical protein